MLEKDINNPSIRQSILKNIQSEDSKNYHNLLKKLFEIEIKYRRQNNDEFYENLYWCAFLLYLIGDPQDVPLMWKAKNINMDTGCGFDIQMLVGAGFEETINFLKSQNMYSIVEYLTQCNESGDFDNLEDWVEFKKNYYYS